MSSPTNNNENRSSCQDELFLLHLQILLKETLQGGDFFSTFARMT